ncbi:FTR1 family protein [Allomyces macrogynus ATCC 38327]|uniref:FTR1 family protein n=1 Tax=Allomyces macrogynus (strain ATCC 38327) TaxID=578462 RepID=A0A0L0SCN6_ALLM3|nr:FTR1 family protein [Allomyces macrogynus ATCC 38327]|eukprot:KNE60202.1 FTR1 family protein [Allomyces macrogynus ATCC 38327]
MVNTIFSVPAFVVFLRETLEAAIILAVLLTFINKLLVDHEEMRKRVVRQVWIGTAAGLLLTVLLGVIFIVVFTTLAVDLWENVEAVWEAVFQLIAVVLITVMAFTMVQVEHWQAKWERKLRQATSDALESVERKKWAMILLPFTVILREGLEAIVLLGGTAASASATAVILPAITGIAGGCLLGYLLFKGGNQLVLRRFMLFSTVFLLFVAAGLCGNAAHEIEELVEDGEEAEGATEDYSDEGYVWNITDPAFDEGEGGFFSVMNSLFGWRHKATVATTIAYFGYWVLALAGLWWWRKRQNRKMLADGMLEDGLDSSDATMKGGDKTPEPSDEADKERLVY